MGAISKSKSCQNTIETKLAFLNYDYLVLSIGTETNYFGMENVKQNSLPMKSIEDAMQFEKSFVVEHGKGGDITKILQRKEKLLNIVIAGGARLE